VVQAQLRAVVQIMDVGLGHRLMPPFEGNNPKGFWADIDLNTLNIEMLSAIDSIDVEILRKEG